MEKTPLKQSLKESQNYKNWDITVDMHWFLIFRYQQYADTFAPLKDTLIMRADRIKPLVDKGFYGTGTIPEKLGVIVSVFRDTMDLTVGVDTNAEFRSPILRCINFECSNDLRLGLKTRQL